MGFWSNVKQKFKDIEIWGKADVFFLEEMGKLLQSNGWELLESRQEDISPRADPNNPNAPHRLPPGIRPPPPGASGSHLRFEYVYRDAEGDIVQADFYFVGHGFTKESGGFIPFIGGAISPELLFKDYMALNGDHLEMINRDKLAKELQTRFGKFSQTLGRMVPRKCTSCGATTDAPMMQATVKCAYCGNSFEVKVERPPAPPQTVVVVSPGYPGAPLGAAPGYPGQPGIPPQPYQGAAPQAAGASACPGCGTPAAPTWKLCPNCGRQLQELCRGCGTPIQQQWKLCPNCGAPHQ